MFSAVDPFPMTQLMNLIGDDYVVWDNAAEFYLDAGKGRSLCRIYIYF